MSASIKMKNNRAAVGLWKRGESLGRRRAGELFEVAAIDSYSPRFVASAPIREKDELTVTTPLGATISKDVVREPSDLTGLSFEDVEVLCDIDAGERDES